MVTITQNDVIIDRYPQQGARFLDPLCQMDICGGGLEISAWMIMRKDNRGSVAEQSYLKNCGHVHDRTRRTANTDAAPSKASFVVIQQDDHELFAELNGIRIPNRPQQQDGIFRAFYFRHVIGRDMSPVL